MTTPAHTGAGRRYSPQPSFRRNIAWASAGNAIYAACQWAMLIALARLGTPETVGTFALALAMTAPVFQLAGLQLRGIQATDSRGEFSFGEYLGVRVAAMATALLFVLLASACTSRGPTVFATVLFVALAKVFEGISDVHYGFLQSRERLDIVAISLAARGAASLAALVLFAAVTRTPSGAAAGMAVGWLTVLLAYDLPRSRTLMRVEGVTSTPSFSLDSMRRLGVVAAPLGVGLMILSLQANVPRYFIEKYFGSRELGIFAALSSLVTIGNIFIGAVGQAASPRLARLHAAGAYRTFFRAILRLILAGAGLGVAALLACSLAGDRVVSLIFGQEYAVRPHAFIWLMAGGAVGYSASLAGYGMTAARQFRPQVPLSLTMLVALCGACAVLVPSRGIVGAAWALLIGSTLQLVGAAVILSSAGDRASSDPSSTIGDPGL